MIATVREIGQRCRSRVRSVVAWSERMMNMRKLNVLTFVSLDGVMQAPGGPEEDSSNGFRHGGWSVGYFDEAVGNEMTAQMGHRFDLVLGRRTYDIFAAYWPQSKD